MSLQLFSADAVDAIAWCKTAMLTNLTYYRPRRVLYDNFTVMLDPPEGVLSVPIHHEAFLVIKQLLTSRSDSLNDDKRLAFDKSVIELLSSAHAAIRKNRTSLLQRVSVDQPTLPLSRQAATVLQTVPEESPFHFETGGLKVDTPPTGSGR